MWLRTAPQETRRGRDAGLLRGGTFSGALREWSAAASGGAAMAPATAAAMAAEAERLLRGADRASWLRPGFRHKALLFVLLSGDRRTAEHLLRVRSRAFVSSRVQFCSLPRNKFSINESSPLNLGSAQRLQSHHRESKSCIGSCLSCREHKAHCRCDSHCCNVQEAPGLLQTIEDFMWFKLALVRPTRPESATPAGYFSSAGVAGCPVLDERAAQHVQLNIARCRTSSCLVKRHRMQVKHARCTVEDACWRARSLC